MITTYCIDMCSAIQLSIQLMATTQTVFAGAFLVSEHNKGGMKDVCVCRSVLSASLAP